MMTILDRQSQSGQTAKNRPDAMRDVSPLHAGAAPTSTNSPSVRGVLDVLRTDIDYIPNASFKTRSAEREILAASRDGTHESRQTTSKLPKDLPAHLARLCEADLLNAEQERRLFRRMNYLKYRAHLMQSSIDPHNPDFAAIEEVESFLTEARATRDRIVRANMRLVISIVKKFVTPQYSFDELLSEGIVTLMQAVDKFDYDRGFRFSTYAYRSIARHAYRSVTQRQQESNRFVTEAEDAVFEERPDGESSSMDERTWHHLRALLTKMLHRLDKRERLIVRARFALGAHRKVSTFQSLADRLGISKERVRQLEQRAMMKLRNMASELDLEAQDESVLSN